MPEALWIAAVHFQFISQINIPCFHFFAPGCHMHEKHERHISELIVNLLSKAVSGMVGGNKAES